MSSLAKGFIIIKNNVVCSLQVRCKWLVILFVLLLVSSPVLADSQVTEECFRPGWPSERSDLQPDPSLLRGTLDNGLRYVIKKNSEPKNRVAIYLHVPAGSLHEQDDQRGAAHFLEHMLFNGTENFPPGSLVEYFQRIGMDFGGDINAFTSYDQTVYHLILPEGSARELETGLLVMADFARGALLLEEEVERERGVIFAEKRTRDSAAYRTHLASSAFAFRGTRLPEREIIGVDETLAAMGREQLKAYYDAWYRPELLTLVVVGDMDPGITEELIRAGFSGLRGAGEPPVCPDFGALVHEGVETFYHFEPELGKTEVAIETIWQKPQESDSLALQIGEVQRMLATMIMNYRLKRLEEEGGKLFSGASYYYGSLVNRLGVGSLSARTDSQGWRETLAVLDQALRQAIEYGFTAEEVERAKREIQADLEKRLATADSENSRRIARRIIHHLNSDRVYQSAEQEIQLYGPLVATITVEEVNQALGEIWNRQNRLISVTGDSDLGAEAEAEVARVFQQTQAVAVAALQNTEQSAFPYLTPLPGAELPPLSQHFPAIGVERLSFANGLIVNLKQTDFERESFQLAAHFGNGGQSEPLPGMKMLAEAVVNGSGSAVLPRSEIERVTAGSSVGLRFQIGEAAFSWSGGGLSKDFELFSQLLHTMLVDPGFRETVFVAERGKAEQGYRRLEQEIEGAIPLAVLPFLAGNDRYFGIPAWDEVARHDFHSLQEWVAGFAPPGDLEISLVGDFDREMVVDILGRYFGGLEFDRPLPIAVEPVAFPEDRMLEVGVETSLDKALVTVAWPTDDFWDISRTRRLHLLASVLEDRLRKTIREKLGATYSARAQSFSSRVFPGYGYLLTQITVEPGTEEAIIAEIMAIRAELVEGGVTEEELNRAKGPMLTSLRDSVQSNRYWLHSVLALSARHPEQLQWPENILKDFAQATAAEVTSLAREYLAEGRAAIATVVPGKAGQHVYPVALADGASLGEAKVQ